MIKSESNRPIQDSIALHINKCKEEANQQLEWLNSGGTYYSPTYRLFKERAETFRKIASIYDEMYRMFIKEDIPQTNPVDERDDILDTQLLSFNEYDESDTLLSNERSEQVANNFSDVSTMTIIDILEILDTQYLSRSKFVECSTRVKYLIGTNVDELSHLLSEYEQVSTPLVSIFCIGLTEWFYQRFNWNQPRDPRIKYKLASFNRSLDALILAYSYEVAEKGKLDSIDGYKFVQKLQRWLETEGENHVKGEPDPYYYEKNGLVSSEIGMFSETYPSNLSPLLYLRNTERVFKLSIWLEDQIKPIIYKGGSTNDESLNDKYFHSIQHRLSSTYDTSLSHVSLSEIEKYITDEVNNESTL